MPERIKNLESSWDKRKENARQKALAAIEHLRIHKQEINFNSVHMQSGVSKNYLYKDQELRKMIEDYRGKSICEKAAWHEKNDKTSKSKDVIIAAKDRRIAKLEEENKRLKEEISNLLAQLYER